MAYAAEKIAVTGKANSETDRFADHALAGENDGVVVSDSVHHEAEPASEDARSLGLSIFQFVGNSLEGGPRGIHPPTHITALAAIAGYAAKLSISLKISRNELQDDFERVTLSRDSSIMVSEQVNRLVLSMERPSVAGIVVNAALRCGLRSMPDINLLLQGNLTNPGMKGGASEALLTDVPPETLLMMYWEPIARFFRSSPSKFDMAPLAAANAVAEAINTYRNAVSVDVALQTSLSTAISMSKIDRAF